jgi:hypothetical protein
LQLCVTDLSIRAVVRVWFGRTSFEAAVITGEGAGVGVADFVISAASLLVTDAAGCVLSTIEHALFVLAFLILGAALTAANGLLRASVSVAIPIPVAIPISVAISVAVPRFGVHVVATGLFASVVPFARGQNEEQRRARGRERKPTHVVIIERVSLRLLCSALCRLAEKGID